MTGPTRAPTAPASELEGATDAPSRVGLTLYERTLRDDETVAHLCPKARVVRSRRTGLWWAQRAFADRGVWSATHAEAVEFATRGRR